MSPVFLSVVLVVHNQDSLSVLLSRLCEAVSPLVRDYELIVLDNGSRAQSAEALRALAGPEGLPNLQVYVLSQEIPREEAVCLGLERALGDYALVFDPDTDDIGQLPGMLDRAAAGSEIVLARNHARPGHSWAYAVMRKLFSWAYRLISGVHLDRDLPEYRLLSKRAANLVLSNPRPALAYRHFPARAGFSRSVLDYDCPPALVRPRSLLASMDKGLGLLLASGRAPMRLAALLPLLGAGLNLVYAVYVVAIGVFKDDVLPGWVSLSLQQSGMFFLLSLGMFVLAEYVAHVARLVSEGPSGYVAQEYTSARLDGKSRLNVEGADFAAPAGKAP